jgi:heterodisulfide reductase subunit A-like polyferredoxin
VTLRIPDRVLRRGPEAYAGEPGVPRRVVVVGGGIAGLATAALLASRGHSGDLLAKNGLTISSVMPTACAVRAKACTTRLPLHPLRSACRTSSSSQSSIVARAARGSVGSGLSTISSATRTRA